MSVINARLYRAIYGRKPAGRQRWEFVPGDGAGHIYNDALFSFTRKTKFKRACKIVRRVWKHYPMIYVR